MLSFTKSRFAGKMLIQTLFFFLLVTQICIAQWYQQTSGTNSILHGVSFTDANNGTVVGGGIYTGEGIILRTTNGGNNWITQYSGSIGNYGVSFTDANNGTVVGIDFINSIPLILRTTNGGTTWTSQLSGTTWLLGSVSFTDENNGTAVGGEGTILRTTNGGVDWTSQSSGTTQTLMSVSFTDANNGTVVGGGQFAGDGIILRTTNGGADWTSQSSGTTNWLGGVSFTDANNGTAVGWGGTILRTTNGGADWTSQSSGTTNDLHGVSFTDANNGTAVGYNGTILRTTNGGTTWNSQTSGTTYTLEGVSFTDANNGTAVGGGWNGATQEIEYIILRTTNGGVPVEFTSFTASANGKEVILNWSTATELNNQLFEVQRSFEGSDFATVGFVNGKGTTTERQDYSYSDKNLSDGKYHYRLKQIDYLGSYEYSDVVQINFRAFNSFLLEQNYPNPFNPKTTIGFGIQNKSNVKITVLNSIGEEVAVVLDAEREPGFYQVEFNASNLPSGVYFYQLKAGNFIQTKKMLLLK